MMGGALGWCQHPALGGNQEKWGHGCGPAPHHQFQVSPCLTQRKSWREKLDTWLMLIKTIHFVFLIIINSANNYPWRETIVLEIMSLGAEIDHDPCIEWWQHPIRHKYSSLMWGSVALCSQRNCEAIGHSQVREGGRHTDIQFTDCETDRELCNINIENNMLSDSTGQECWHQCYCYHLRSVILFQEVCDVCLCV